MPAYSCPAVASAVLKAGLKPVLCDVNLADFGYRVEDLERKINDRTLAVIPVHLFGYPSRMEEIVACTARSGAWVIEDAAQAFGNPAPTQFSAPPGLQGDAGFFSFGRGKPLSVLHGGLLVIRSQELRREAISIYESLGEPGRWNHLKYALRLSAYWLFSKPRLYWAPLKVPALRLGETFFEKEFSVQRGSASAARVTAPLLDSLGDETEARRRNAAYYAEHFQSLPALEPPPRPDYPYLRYPLLARTGDLRNQILKELAARGLAGAVFYPCPLNELPGLREILQDRAFYPNARSLAERLVTLPVHSGVSDRERAMILEAIGKACSASVPVSDRSLHAGTIPRTAPATEPRE